MKIIHMTEEAVLHFVRYNKNTDSVKNGILVDRNTLASGLPH